MSSTFVNVAIPDLSRHFMLGQGRAQWVTSGFMVAMTVSMPTTPWLLARLGYRRTYGLCMVLPLKGSACGGLAGAFWLVLLARVAEGRAAYLQAASPAKEPVDTSQPGHPVRIVGVVSAHATTYADSLAAARVVEAPAATRLADGMAVRRADASALALLAQGLDHLVTVTDDEVAEAMRTIYTATHNVAEGAGAAGFAGAMKERNQLQGRVVGTTLSGSNVDATVLGALLGR